MHRITINRITEADIDAALREIARDDKYDASKLTGPPRDGLSDCDRELPCWPRSYEDMTPKHTDEHPNFGTVIGAIVVIGFIGAMLASAAAIVREVGVL